MKKWTRLTALLLFTVLLFSFAACGETEQKNTVTKEEPFVPTDAVSLWQKIDDTMNTIDSYAIATKTEITYYFRGYELKLTGEGGGVRSEQKENFYSYLESTSRVVCEDLSIDQTGNYMEAYYDGKMYRATEVAEEYNQKLVCAITPDEFLKAESEDLLKDMDLTECTGKEFSKNDDGTWNLKFSGYTKKNIDLFLKNIEFAGGDYGDFGVEIEDMTVDVVADALFQAKTIKIVLIFWEEEEATAHPNLTLTVEYSKYNQAELDPEKLKTEEYTQVDSIAILDDVTDGLEEIENAASGKFVLETESITSMDGQKETVSEKDTVSFGRKNGGYYYDVLVESTGGTMRIQYQSGTQTITYGSDSESIPSGDEEAKEMISYLINSASYDSSTVTHVEKTGEGVYLLKIEKPNISAFEAEFEGTGIKIASANQEIQVTFSGEKLSKIDSKVTLQCTYGNKTFTVTSDSLVTLEEVTQAPEEA